MKPSELFDLAYQVAADQLGDLRQATANASLSDIANLAANTAVSAAGLLFSARNVGRLTGVVLSGATLLSAGQGAAIVAPVRAGVRLGTRGLSRLATAMATRAEARTGVTGFLARGTARTLNRASRVLGDFDKGLADTDRVLALGVNNAAVTGIETTLGGILAGQGFRQTVKKAGNAAWNETSPKLLYESLKRTKTRMAATGERAGDAFKRVVFTTAPRAAATTAKTIRQAPAATNRALQRAHRKARARLRHHRRALHRLERMDPKLRRRTLWQNAKPALATTARHSFRVAVTGTQVALSAAAAITRISAMASLTGVSASGSTNPIRASHVGAMTKRLAREAKHTLNPAHALTQARARNAAPRAGQRAAYWATYRTPPPEQRPRQRTRARQSAPSRGPQQGA